MKKSYRKSIKVNHYICGRCKHRVPEPGEVEPTVQVHGVGPSLNVECEVWMWMASRTLLLQYLCSFSITHAPSQSMITETSCIIYSAMLMFHQVTFWNFRYIAMSLYNIILVFPCGYTVYKVFNKQHFHNYFDCVWLVHWCMAGKFVLGIPYHKVLSW